MTFFRIRINGKTEEYISEDTMRKCKCEQYKQQIQELDAENQHLTDLIRSLSAFLQQLTQQMIEDLQPIDREIN